MKGILFHTPRKSKVETFFFFGQILESRSSHRSSHQKLEQKNESLCDHNVYDPPRLLEICAKQCERRKDNQLCKLLFYHILRIAN